MPVVPRIYPSEAGRIIRDNILNTCSVVTADVEQYLEALMAVQDRGLPGA